jgi:hypothetical protein
MKTKTTTFGNLPIRECEYLISPDTIPMGEIHAIIIHNTLKHLTVDSILENHQSRGFAGIGYHFAIDETGTVYATRPTTIMGAHAYGRNRGSVGIVMMNIERCLRAGNAPIMALAQLYHEINAQVGKSLPVHSHTHAQFSYLSEQVARVNLKLTPDLKIEIPQFGEDIAHPEVFADMKSQVNRRLNESATTIENELGPTRPQELQLLLKLAQQLKNCPLEHYHRLAEACTHD